MTKTTTKTTAARAKDAGAKLPADHAAEQEALASTATVTVDGFTITFNPRAVRDYRLNRRLLRGEPDAVPDLIERVLGDQEDAVTDHLADEDGYADMQDLMEFVKRVQEAAGLGN